MATKVFPTAQTRGPTTTFTTADTRIADFTQGAAAVSQVDATVATLAAASNPQATGLVAPWKRAASITLSAAGVVESGATIGASLFFVTPGITAVTIAGNITANIRAAESATQANYGVGCKVYRVKGGVVDAAFAQGSNLVEISTPGEGASSITLAVTSTAFATGDSIGILFFYVGVGTSASGRTATGFWDGAAAASGDTFLSFTEAITETVVRAKLTETLVATRSAATW